VVVRGFPDINTAKLFTSFPVAHTGAVNGQEREAKAGDVFVVKAGEPHKFVSSDADPVRQMDVHLKATFEQELLEEWATAQPSIAQPPVARWLCQINS
jgi:uncharacterized protein YjlB